MKIIPIETKELKLIVSKEIRYHELYELFETAYASNLRPPEWYESCIRVPLECE